MSVYSDMLDSVVTTAEAELGLKATRDPGLVGSLVAAHGGCVFVQFPEHIDRLMHGPSLEVPVSLVAPAPADLTSVDWLLDHMDALVETFGAREVRNGPIDVGSESYPAVTCTAQIALDMNGA